MYDDEEVITYMFNSDGEKVDVGIEFNSKTDMKNPIFMEDQMFGNAQILREVLLEHAIQHGHEYSFARNETRRIQAICKEDDCPFELYVFSKIVLLFNTIFLLH